MKTTRFALPILALAALSGCANEDEVRTADTSATLTRAESCDGLLASLKKDALIKMHRSIDAQIEWARQGDHYWGFETGGSATSGSTGSGMDLGSPSNGAPEGGATPPAHSETNTQVEGVDEADIVKTDGNFIYLLHGQKLEIITAFPASSLGIAGSVSIEGHPTEMFLADDKVVVYSSIWDTSSLLDQSDAELNYGYGGFTKITVLTTADGVATVDEELYFEGQYSSSRRIGSHVRTVLTGGFYGQVYQTYPNYDEAIDWDDVDSITGAYEQLRAENVALINASSLSDYLPGRFVKENGSLEAQPPSCTDFFVPTPGTTDYGLTQIQSIDLDALDAGVKQASVFGYADTVYSSHDAIYLAARGWNDMVDWPMQEIATPISTSRTHIHKFDIATNPAEPAYVASGTVPGFIHNQFSLDEKDGHLRVATTDQLMSSQTWTQENHLFVLGQNGAALETTGAVKGLAPEEQIFSARFVGDRGYVVTFRQVDPLFVFDLSDPNAPKLLSELKIPGFSDYMHPLEGGTHLLTIGRDGTDAGEILNPALQIFDVTDPLDPKLVHKHVLEDGYSEAAYNHKAFTYYQGMLAIPFSSWDYNSGNAQSTLQLFDIDVDAGITKRGAIDHSGFYTQIPEDDYCYYGYWGVDVRRGVFIDDSVYSISTGGVLVHKVDDLSPMGQLTLPSIDMDPGYYGCGFEEGF